jgi:hypothetical protein
MMPTRLPAAVLLAWCLATPALRAQAPRDTALSSARALIHSGARVRVRSNGLEQSKALWRYGYISSWHADTIGVAFDEGDTLHVPFAAVGDLHLRRSKPGPHPRHVIIGGVMGALAGAGAVVATAFSCHDVGDGPPCGIVIIFTPVAAGVGLVIGAVAGAVIPTGEWVPVG